jgi:N-acyl-D-amino-acid deacylase
LTTGPFGTAVISPPGAAADLVLLDRSTLAVGPARLLRDFPTGAARLVWEQRGYKATIVNGEVLIDDGVATGSTSGTVLRFNQ